MEARRTNTVDLADFLADKLRYMSYRDVEAKTGVSRGALEAIVKRENRDFPKLETLTRIARAYGRALWEVVEMAGANLDLPQNDTNRARRLAQLVERHPKLEHLAKRLLDKIETSPDYVDGIIMGIEAALGESPDDTAQ